MSLQQKSAFFPAMSIKEGTCYVHTKKTVKNYRNEKKKNSTVQYKLKSYKC